MGKKRKLHAGLVKKTITGFEPAGGCVVWVSIMTEIAVPTATATDHQWAPKIFRQARPMNELRKCPTTTLRGCENGTSGNPNIKTHEAPNEPRINVVDSTSESLATALISLADKTVWTQLPTVWFENR